MSTLQTSPTPPRSRRKFWIGIGLGASTLLIILCVFTVIGFNRVLPRIGVAKQFAEKELACESLFQKGQYTGAIKACSEALALRQDYVQALLTRGYSMMQQGAYTEALADFDTALSYEPNNGLAFVYKGFAYTRLRDHDKVITTINDMFSRSIQNPTQRSYGHLYRGTAYHEKGELELALQDYQQGIQEDPSISEAYENFERVMVYQHSLDDVIVSYTDFIKKNPQSPDLYYHRGIVYRQVSKNDLAVKDFQQALRLKPNDSMKVQIEAQVRDIELLVK